ncbi:putative membrane protein [Janibacter sp. HTCC2649]|nr:putative membrane protein [Janibacter sp. HTCC2649]
MALAASVIALATTGAAPTFAASVAQSKAAVPSAAATKAASKVPSLVSQRIAKVTAAAGSRHSLDAKAQRSLSDSTLRVDGQGRLDLELHALTTLKGRERADLNRLGASVRSGSDQWVKPAKVKSLPNAGILRALVPYDKVDSVAALPWVAAVRPTEISPPDAGSFLSEGVPLHRADDTQAIGVDGSGIDVGVISDGVTSIAAAQALGDLPAGVNVLNAGSGDEGTSMLEIVHDMAPGAGLLFHGTGGGVGAHVTAQNALAAAGVDIITEDIPFDSEPAFQKGLAATNGETLAASGVWVSSSSGNLNSSHAPRVAANSTGTFPDGAAAAPAGCPGINANSVAFNGADTTFDVSVAAGASIGATLQWSEPRAIFPTAGAGGFTNLDLYILDAAGANCVASSTGAQGGGSGDTIEQASWTNGGAAAATVKLVVNRTGATGAKAVPTIDLRWRGNANAVDALGSPGSLNPDSNYTDFATSAGAVNAGSSQDPTTVGLETFSGQGPVTLLGTTVCSTSYPCPASAPAGQNQSVAGAAGRTAIAPTYTAADGVSVSGAGGFGAGTCPAVAQGDCRFFGTSAATPSSAGVAALVLDASGGPGSLTASGLTSVLNANATDRGPAGADNAWGSGVLDAYSAATNRADLRVAKNCLPNGDAAAGAAYPCTITVTNDGAAIARAVTLSDQVLGSGSFTLATTSAGCTAPAGVQTGSAPATCALGDLASGASVVVVISERSDEPQDLADTATVSSGTIDPNLGNNVASDTLHFVGSADVSIVKSAPPTATSGGQITWTSTVSNTGPSTATNVVVRDVLPAAVTVNSVAGSGGASCTAGVPGQASQPTTCSFGNLASGASRSMTVVATIDPGFSGLMHNDAVVSASTPDPDMSGNTATVSTSVSASADLSVTKVDTPDPVLAGRTVTWTVDVRNNGPSTATQVKLVDALPDEVTFVSASATAGTASCSYLAVPVDPPAHRVDCNLGTIAPTAGPTTVVIRGLVKSETPSGTISNTATVSSVTTDPVPGNNSATAQTTVNRAADLSLAFTADKDVYKPSSTIIYTATVTNIGPSDAQTPKVTVALPPIKAAVYVFDTASCVKAGQTLTCTRPTSLVSGGTWSFNVHLLVKGSKGVVDTTATVTSATSDPVAGNNSVTRSVKIGK